MPEPVDVLAGLANTPIKGSENPMRILCVALNPTIDVSTDAARVRPTHKVRTHNQRQEPGGGGVNVARVIVALGGDAELLIMSGGPTGAWLEDAIAKLSLKLDVVRTPEPTRIAFMVHEEETNLEFRFVPEGPLIDGHEIDAALDRIAAWRGDYVIGSGSLPRGAPDDTYARMAKHAADSSIRFVLDCSGAPLRAALNQGGIFLVKPSLGELEAATGKKLSTDTAGDAAMELVARGAAEHVAVTLGQDGALIASRDGIIRAPAIDVPVRSAVGAGDSFVGGLVWALASGKSTKEAFNYGMAAGAAAVMTEGAELCRKADILDLYARLQ